MLLIIFVGLVAKIALVSGCCCVGKQGAESIDFNRTNGTWEVRKHLDNNFENNFKCVRATYGPVEGNNSTVILQAIYVSNNSSVKEPGNLIFKGANEFEELFQNNPIWNGIYCVIATDYECYIILKLCSYVSSEQYYYVAYRNKTCVKATEKIVQKVLKKKLEAIPLVNWEYNNCPW